MPDSVAVTPQSMLCFNLYAASHAFTRFYQPILEPMGLTYPQYLVLLALRREDGRTVGSLGEELALETNTLSPLLKRMEAAELIGRERRKDDERKVIVALTESGRALGERAARVPECIASCVDIPLAEIKEATELLARLRRQMAAAEPPPPPA